MAGGGIGTPLGFEWPRMYLSMVYVRVLIEECPGNFWEFGRSFEGSEWMLRERS
jgi:hypothetical protein